MIQLQPWNQIKKIFGYGAGAAQGTIGPKSIKDVEKSVYVYGQDPISSWYRDQMKLQADRFQLYREFDDMDADDILCCALDLYSDEASQVDITTGRTIWVEAENAQIESILNNMFDRIGANNLCYPIARELAKFGDSFSAVINEQKTDGTPGKIAQIVPSPCFFTSRVEDSHGRLSGYSISPIEQMGSQASSGAKATSDDSEGVTATDPPWSFIHWRLLGRNRQAIHGSSFLAAARIPFRRLRMAEDSLVSYRLKRCPDRFAFGIKGLGGMSPEDRFKTMNMLRTTLRKKQQIEPSTGAIKQELNPVTPDEDLIYDSEAVSIDHFAGSAQINPVHDIEYLRKRLCGALRIPPDYLGFSDSAKGGALGESTLSQLDVNFSRMEKRLQRAVMEGFAVLCMLELAWAGIDPLTSDSKFTIHMNPVSALDEKQRLELEKVRIDTLENLQRIGKDLGLDSDEWQAYLLKRSMIPQHLLRPSGKEPTKIIKGTMDVMTESQASVITERVAKNKDVRELLESQLIVARDVFMPYHWPNTYIPEASLAHTIRIEDITKLRVPGEQVKIVVEKHEKTLMSLIVERLKPQQEKSNDDVKSSDN